MESSVLIAMFVFSFAMSITPGPVNMVILSSGVNYGVKRTIPYISGATIGFILLLLSIGLGLYQLIQAYPHFLNCLAMVGSLYIAYMGYKIATSKPEISVKEELIPKFQDGFFLQWVNPKAWIACISGASIFLKADSYGQFLIFSGIYFLICYGSLSLWAIIGQQLAGLLKNSLRLKLFNLTMATMLIGTAACLGYSYY
jgi:threonine/homoserine/homoserine lactone efflux protein